jgi:uncharacterized protein YndB with AHSA1/START domain
MTSTRVSRHLNASRDAVYKALLDPKAVAQWRVPTGMSSVVHEFEAREGGRFRVSLTYEAQDAVGKTSAHTDTYHGYFLKLVPNEQVVEVIEFETGDSSMKGEMTISMNLSDAAGGTQVVAIHDGVPAGVDLADNEVGWKMSLDKLAALVERG